MAMNWRNERSLGNPGVVSAAALRAFRRWLEPLVRLAYRPPYQHAAMVSFFAARALPGIESLDAHGMRRTIALPHRDKLLSGKMSAEDTAKAVEAVAAVELKK